ncbi:MAG: YfiH family protein [Gammaproteobacteria bacterium]|jgi:YfiH family protein
MPEIKNSSAWINAEWNVPAWIKAGISTRHEGSSLAPYNNLNLALHVGDDVETVNQNRNYLKNFLVLPEEPIWLNQIHGDRIVNANNLENLDADGIYTNQEGVICAILTADCVPLLMCNSDGRQIAAVHVGWRGICTDIIKKAVCQLGHNPDNVITWIGPHIGEDSYEVGDDVYAACINTNKNLSNAFTKNQRGRWNASLKKMVQHQLQSYGINHIYSTNYCTFKNESDFFSYRRNEVTGRMASMIWIER